MKVALVHDYIKEYGGAERVLEALHEIWPDAPVFTSVYLPEFLGPHRQRFKDWNIKTSIFQSLPFKAKLISPMRIFAPFIFNSFNFSPPAGGFDVVIVSATGAYTPNIIQKSKVKSQKLICYCHTPPRYLYGYATAREWKKNIIFRVFGELVNHFLRLVDFKSSQNVDFFIANSRNVEGRIKKFYKKDATVIYPPVDIAPGPATTFPPVNARSSLLSSNELRVVGSPSSRVTPRSYFLAGGRLARPKHIGLIIETFVKLKLPLKIFGRGFAGYELELKSKANSKIEFLGEVSDSEKLELMRNAKAFVFASVDEDFGITPVEAMSVGTPVIAYKSGGVVESVLGGKTGIFFDNLTAESLLKAIERFSNIAIKPEDCINQAQKFSKERFKKEIKSFVNRYGK
ncbi:glycosyltransferase [Patescibacteria group bacterium]|nr:glycosyltransferase [Patescibacteria group bacterium]